MRKKTFVAVIAVSTCMLFSGAAFVQSGDDKKGETGTRGGPGLNKAVISAGFDSDKLRDLDPPPDRKSRGE